MAAKFRTLETVTSRSLSHIHFRINFGRVLDEFPRNKSLKN